MKREEKLLFKNLCCFKSKEFDSDMLKYASPNVLGCLFYNRMAGVAYGVLKANNVLNRVNREFRNALRGAYDNNIEKNKSFFYCVNYLGEILKKHIGRYALLKGAVLCGEYPEGYRTSNDIDILANVKDITAIGKTLTEEGFKQGKIINDRFIPATRQEIIESKMTRGETVPYIRQMGLPGFDYLEVDLNFSLDYKNSDDYTVTSMLDNVAYFHNENVSVQSLCAEDFFIHLCGHLYKEVSTLAWVRMKRDMTLYKYCDIYMLLDEMSSIETERVFEKAEKYNMKKECACAVLQTCALFGNCNAFAFQKSKNIISDDKNFIHSVISPGDNKVYVYKNKNIKERFYMDNRIENLREVINDEKT